MTSIKYTDNLLLFRTIQRELKQLIKKDPKSSFNEKDPTIDHMLTLLRDNQVTEERFCRPRNHYKYFAETYLTYLKSTRQRDELTNKYFNKGDKTVESSARLVGLELPKKREGLD